MSQSEHEVETNLLQVRSRWDYVRKKLRRRGVVEVNKSHPHHDMLCAIQLAIRQLFTDNPENNIAKDELCNEDFNDVLKIQVQTPAGNNYEFKSYANPVFACIRSAVNIDTEDFINSLSPKHPVVPYLEFISNSRSGQDFYFSNNQRFILKTDLEHCVQYFLSILSEYLNHFQTNPHSLLVKFLGLYSIKAPRSRKKYFLVMQSIFYPTVRLEERFDIKGCLTNRYQDPNPPGKKTILVLKDQNFLHEKLELGNEKDWFLTQLRADVDFLLSIGVQDYSLLVGRHPLHAIEKRESVSNLVLRMKKSFGHDKGQNHLPIVDDGDDDDDDDDRINHDDNSTQQQSEEKSFQNKEDINIELQSKHCDKTPENSSQKKSSKKKGSVSPLKRKNVNFLRSLSDKSYLDSTGLKFQNKRLLLNCENSLHIIDGVNYRYYIGVIDFFTQFGCHQQISKVLKDMKTCCGNHSTVPPDRYGERFYEFIADHVV
ncbi:hypothetical protein ACF0H5_021740 [Mactra antiquata]